MDRKPADTAEIITQVGQEDDKKAIPLVKEVMKEQEKKEEEDAYIDLDRLHKAADHTIKGYNMLLAELLQKRLHSVDWPKGWYYAVTPNDVGVIFTMNYKKQFFQAAFKPTGEEKYDLNAVNMYVVRAENTIDRIMEKSPAGENV